MLSEEKIKNIWMFYFEGFERIFDSKGRSGKSAFWSFALVNVMVSIGISFLQGLAVGSYVLLIFSFLYSVASVIAFINLTIRRLHDIGRDGQVLWLFPGLFSLSLLLARSESSTFRLMAFMCAIALIGVLVWMYVLMLQKGTGQNNQYGEAVIENAEDNHLANLCAIVYIVLSIGNRVYVYNQIQESMFLPSAPQTVSEKVDASVGSDAENAPNPGVPTHNNEM